MKQLRVSKSVNLTVVSPFSQAEQLWQLPRLYQSMARAKREVAPQARQGLSKTEKQDLCGLLCGYSPAEIAEKTCRQSNTVEVRLCNTLYRYVEVLLERPRNSLRHWSDFSNWLGWAGYRTQSRETDAARVLTLPDYATPEVGNIYLAENILAVNQGSISGWIGFPSQAIGGNDVVLQTDDGRIALLASTVWSSERQGVIGRVVTTVGGNREGLDNLGGKGSWLEASILLDTQGQSRAKVADTSRQSAIAFAGYEWHLVSMTWWGYPEGGIRLYVDGTLIGEKFYTGQTNDSRPLFSLFSVGFKPSSWIEVDGELQDRVTPPCSLPVFSENRSIQVKDLRVYRRVLGKQDFRQMRGIG